MSHPSALHLWLGVSDLVIAIGMASLGLTFPSSGCAGLGRLICWAAAVPVAFTAIWLLVHPRSGCWGAIVVGVAALVIAGCVLNERPSDAAESPIIWALLLAGIAQLPVGMWIRRAVRTVRAIA